MAIPALLPADEDAWYRSEDEGPKVPAVGGLASWADGETEIGVLDGKEPGRRGEPGRKDDPEGEDEVRKAWWLLLSRGRGGTSPGRATNAPS
jgi:hypothetical protein